MWTAMQAREREQELGKKIEDMYEMYQGRMEKLNVEVWQGLCNYVDNADFLVQGGYIGRKCSIATEGRKGSVQGVVCE